MHGSGMGVAAMWQHEIPPLQTAAEAVARSLPLCLIIPP